MAISVPASLLLDQASCAAFGSRMSLSSIARCSSIMIYIHLKSRVGTLIPDPRSRSGM